MRGPIDAPMMAEFVAALDDVNRAAETSPGFVWRLRADETDRVNRIGDDPLLVFNLTVWNSVEDLKNYTYRGLHGKIFARRAHWFERMEQMQFAMWWIPAGTRPTSDEAMCRLEHLRHHGPSAWAFTFQFPVAPGEGLVARPL